MVMIGVDESSLRAATKLKEQDVYLKPAWLYTKACNAAGVSDAVTSKAAEIVKAQRRPLAANVAPLGCGTMQWLKRAAQCQHRPDSCAVQCRAHQFDSPVNQNTGNTLDVVWLTAVAAQVTKRGQVLCASYRVESAAMTI
jgi:hypothetical protein